MSLLLNFEQNKQSKHHKGIELVEKIGTALISRVVTSKKGYFIKCPFSPVQRTDYLVCKGDGFKVFYCISAARDSCLTGCLQ